MPDFQTLTSQLEELQNAHGFWSNLSVWLIAVSVCATAVYFFAQWMTNKRGNELSKKQATIIRTKDEQLVRDLKDKDEQMEKIRADAQKEIARVESDAKKYIADVDADANRKIEEAREQANIKIAEARAEAARANEQAHRLEQENIKLATRLEEERNSRLEMENAIAPRIMEQSKSSQNLKPFAVMQAIIETVNDFEARRTAGQIAMTLQMANWKIVGPVVVQDDFGFFEGVDIETNAGALPREDRSSEAAESLIAQLEANKIESSRHPAINLPINALRIKVGLKPITYFYPKEVKERLKEVKERLKKLNQ